MKSIGFIIELGIYPFDVFVSINQTDKELFSQLYEYGFTDDELKELILSETTKGRTIMLDGNQTVIRLKKDDNYNRFISNLAHEVFHATTFILHKIGMKLKLMTSDESYAYLISFLMNEILNNLKNGKK